jgi:hypothetical protein
MEQEKQWFKPHIGKAEAVLLRSKPVCYPGTAVF